MGREHCTSIADAESLDMLLRAGEIQLVIAQKKDFFEQRAHWSHLRSNVNLSRDLISLFTLVARKLRVKFSPILVHRAAECRALALSPSFIFSCSYFSIHSVLPLCVLELFLIARLKSS